MSRDLQFGTLADCATRAMVTITELACDLSPQESKQHMQLDQLMLACCHATHAIAETREFAEASSRKISGAPPTSVDEVEAWQPVETFSAVVARDDDALREGRDFARYAQRVAKVRGQEVPVEADDEELVVGDLALDVHCPITQQLMHDPVKNVCGHTYSRAGALNLCKRRPVPCPIPGCSQTLRSEQLVDDPDMKFAVLEHERSQHQQSAHIDAEEV